MVEEKKLMVELLTALFPDSKIYLFGSRARKDYKESSDIDIAIDIGRKMTIQELSRAKNVLEGLNIPEKIDVVDMQSIPENLKTIILTEGIIWKG